MGRHRHMANVRADGIAVVLGPLLRDVRIVAAALVDVDSGMVLDAWSAGGPATGSPDLELIGAQHAEIVRCALQVLRTWCGAGGAAEACEVVIGEDGGVRHLLRTVPDPLGDRLALAVVVDGPQRVLDRVRKRLQTVSVDALTAGPSMIRRPSGGGWSFDPPGPDVPAQPEPGAGLLPPGAGTSGGRAPGAGVPGPREGRSAPRPGVPSPRDPGPPVTSLGQAPTAGWAAGADPGFPGAVPAMAGLRPVPPAADAPADPVHGPARAQPGADGGAAAADAATAGPGTVPATSATRLTRRPMLFSVAGGDGPAARGAGPHSGGAGDPAAAPAVGPVVDAPPRPPVPRPPSPPAALPAPARRRPSEP